MPRIAFWIGKRESIEWTFDRLPKIGEEVVLGDRGVFQVLALRESQVRDTGLDAEYTSKRVRDASKDDLTAMHMRGVNRLPPSAA